MEQSAAVKGQTAVVGIRKCKDQGEVALYLS